MKYLFLFIIVCLITMKAQAQNERKMRVKMLEFATKGAADSAVIIISDAKLGDDRVANVVDAAQWPGQILDDDNQPRLAGEGLGRMWYIMIDPDNETFITTLVNNNSQLQNIAGMTKDGSGNAVHNWTRIDPLD